MKYIKNIIKKIKNNKILLPFRNSSYYEDGIISFHNIPFLDDAKFKEAYNVGKETKSWGDSEIRWRVHVAITLADFALNIEGDFIECGVNKGGLSSSICEFTKFDSKNKNFYLVDTYNGLDSGLINNEEKKLGIDNYSYEECYEQVIDTFKNYKNIKIIRGTIPEILDTITVEKIAFASIDLNCSYPEIKSLEFIWPKLQKHGIILLDDYGWRHHKDQQIELDKFFKKYNKTILSLPTGQGIIIK